MRPSAVRASAPTAIFAQSLGEAQSVFAAAMRAGISVPGDLSILGIAHQNEGGVGIAIDALTLPSNEVGRRAVDLLRRKIRRPSERLPTEVVPLRSSRLGGDLLSCGAPLRRETEA